MSLPRHYTAMTDFIARADGRRFGMDSIYVHSLGAESGREAVSLAMDFVERGDLDEDAALWILAHSHPEDGNTLPADALRTAVMLSARADEIQSWTETHWAAMVLAAVRPYRLEGRGWDGCPITTPEQLDACVAIVTVATNEAAENLKLIRHGATYRAGKAPDEYTIIKNVALDALLREQPYHLQTVLAYIEDHDAGTSFGDEEVALLRARLDGIDAPLRSGWL